MKTIKNDYNCEYIVKKSKFISYIYYIESIEDAKEKINTIRNKYKDATHVCFGYIVDNVIRFSDDGEPNGTAGMPIVNVLNNKELNHILAIVVRYFGGIKLGAGGLVRAYTNAITESLDKIDIVDLKEGYYARLTFNISNIKSMDNILKKYNLNINKEFTEDVCYEFLISVSDYEILKDEINFLGNIEIQKNALIR